MQNIILLFCYNHQIQKYNTVICKLTAPQINHSPVGLIAGILTNCLGTNIPAIR